MIIPILILYALCGAAYCYIMRTNVLRAVLAYLPRISDQIEAMPIDKAEKSKLTKQWFHIIAAIMFAMTLLGWLFFAVRNVVRHIVKGGSRG